MRFLGSVGEPNWLAHRDGCDVAQLLLSEVVIVERVEVRHV